MELKIHGRGVEITDQIQGYVGKKFNRLSRHLPQMMDATAEIKRTSSRSGADRIVVQLTLMVKGQVLRAQRRGSSVSEAVDTAVDVMDRQIRRYKGRRYRSNQGRKSLRDLPDGLASDPDDEMPAPDEMEEMPIKVVRRKRFPMIGMTVDDAIAEMELLNHSFYLVPQRGDGQLQCRVPARGRRLRPHRTDRDIDHREDIRPYGLLHRLDGMRFVRLAERSSEAHLRNKSQLHLIPQTNAQPTIRSMMPTGPRIE